jgi:RimJ/RimL family protein N-acetyltransferase
MMTAAGFVREGYLRGHVLKAGQRRDVVLLGILAADWQARREKARAVLVEGRMIAA